MAKRKTKSTVGKIENVTTDVLEPSQKFYVVEMCNEQCKSRSLLADKVSGGVAKFNSVTKAKRAAEEFLSLIKGVIPYSYSIRKYK